MATTSATTATTGTTAATTTAAVQALIASIRQAVNAAQLDLASPGALSAQIAAGYQFTALAQSLIKDLQAQLSPALSPATYTVQVGDTLPLLAQRLLGDPLQFTALQQSNGLHGLAIVPGQQLVVPLVAASASA